MEKLQYNNQDFPVYIAKPGTQPKGGLIVIHEVWGLSDHIKQVADRFAKEGYLVLAPNLVSDTDIQEKMGTLNLDLFNPEKRNEAQPKLRALMVPIQNAQFTDSALGKLEVCFNYLYNLPEVKQKVGVVGFCFGGTYSFKFAEVEPRLKAAVPFYGRTGNDQAEINQIKCPILAFYGENDKDLMENLPNVKEMMGIGNIDFTAQVYAGAGHAFFNDSNPYAYQAKPAQDAWSKTLEFLAKNI